MPTSNSASSRPGLSWSATTRAQIAPTVCQATRRSRRTAVLSILVASHATRSSKSRVKPDSTRANGTPSRRTHIQFRSPSFLLNAIAGFPARELVKQWLKAGHLDGGVFHATPAGTPQGGVISPLLANIALHGMEAALGVWRRDGRIRSDRA